MTTIRCILYLSLATSSLFGCVGAGASGSSSDDELVGGGFETTTPTVIRRRPRSAGEPAANDLAGGEAASIQLEPVQGSETSVNEDGPAVSLTPECEALALMWTAEEKAFEDRVLELTNEARAQPRECGQYGAFAAVNPVRTNEALRCAARIHTLDMIERVFFDHVSPDGVGPDQRALDAGYDWIAVGENIAAGSTTPRDVVDGWLESPGHCQNIMSDSYTELGVGYSPREAGRFRHYWTQVFGDRASR